MKKKFNRVYQFKITLERTKPPIWRRIQVPGTYTFWDLHVAIQDAMGWIDYHLHEFKIVDPLICMKMRIGIPDDEFERYRDILAGWRQRIARWFSMENSVAYYIYDFGDGWEHQVRLERILPRREGVVYPVCIAGKRACPPEDCGGVRGYEQICKGESEFQEAFSDYDPEYFDPKEIVFDDPVERKRHALCW